MSFWHGMRGAAPPAVFRLAVVNSIGFSASTILPLWLGDISAHLGAPAWYGGMVATLQLSVCALMNVATPFLFRRAAPVRLGRAALLVAAAGNITASFSNPVAFLAGGVVGGASLGVLLNCTNRLAAGFHQVQSAYSIFQIVEVCFGASLFLGASRLAQGLGFGSMFTLCAALEVIGAAVLPAMARPPEQSRAARAPRRFADASSGGLALLALMIFFVGQSSINSFMIPIGREAGLESGQISGFLAAGMFSALAGAFGARILGERLGLTLPVIIVALLLAATFLLITSTRSHALFVAAAILLPCCTILVVPYFFTWLAKLDRSGRFASVGPAFLLSGVALGPTLAVFTRSHFGFRALGVAAASAMGLAALMFARSRRSIPSAEINPA